MAGRALFPHLKHGEVRGARAAGTVSCAGFTGLAAVVSELLARQGSAGRRRQERGYPASARGASSAPGPVSPATGSTTTGLLRAAPTAAPDHAACLTRRRTSGPHRRSAPRRPASDRSPSISAMSYPQRNASTLRQGTTIAATSASPDAPMEWRTKVPRTSMSLATAAAVVAAVALPASAARAGGAGQPRRRGVEQDRVHDIHRAGYFAGGRRACR